MYFLTGQLARFTASSVRAIKPILALTMLTVTPAAFAQGVTAQQSLEANITSPGGSMAGNQVVSSRLLQAVAGFFSVGGYYFTDGSATRALGTPKFYGDTQIFAKPKHFAAFDLTGGLEFISANDHLIPFQGGNEFNLIGPAFKLSTHRALNRLRPFVSGGLFLGRVRSVQLNPGFNRSNFAPSISVGVEYPLRYVTLYAGYRVSQQIHQITTDGVSVGLRFF